MKYWFIPCSCMMLVACGSPAPASKSEAGGTPPRIAARNDAQDAGWLPFEATVVTSDRAEGQSCAANGESRPVESGAVADAHGEGKSVEGAVVGTAAASSSYHPTATAVADTASALLEACCTELPEKDDFRRVLHTALHSVATPDFDAYHELMTARGCTLLSSVDAQCRSQWNFIDFGYSEVDWANLSLTDKARAYWNTVDQRKSRWLAVDLSSVRVGSDPKAIPRKGEGVIMSYSFYRPPEPFQEGAAPVAFVHFDLTVFKGVAPLTFCFAFDKDRRQWYPWWTMVQHSDRGPACKIRL